MLNRNIHPSISENNGLAAIADRDLCVYSVGISTGGVAEMRMAVASPHRHIIATTIDPEGVNYARKQIQEAGLSGRIDVKLEDVAASLSYPNECFDFIYARLVLHYLPRNSLIQALCELYRVLKTNGRMFVVVRSEDCVEARDKRVAFDPETGMTTCSSNGLSYSRYFHSADSIQSYLKSSGFHINQVRAYHEQLCVDFQRTQLSDQVDALIEVIAIK